MRNYIYELLQAPVPEDEWTTEWDISEHPDAFPIANRIGKAENRDEVISYFGRWLKEHQLGHCDGGAFSVNADAVDRYFEGRFAQFQRALTALQQLNEAQFIHEHNWVQRLIDQLCSTFTQKYTDYVLWDDDMIPMPLDEFLRKAQPEKFYYLGAVLEYTY